MDDLGGGAPVRWLQGGAPPVISWFINPINYRYNPYKP